MASWKDRAQGLLGRTPPRPEAPGGAGGGGSEAARLRELAAERRRQQEEAGRHVDLAQLAADKRWREAREALGDRAVALVQAEILRRARVAAERGDTGLSVDLGVNEDRLRASSTLRELNLAEAVLAREPGAGPWDYVERIGWLLQARDGQGPSPHGEALLAALEAQGFSALFLPFFVQESHAEPFCNARLEVQW